MLADWAYSLIVGLLDFFVNGLPPAGSEEAGIDFGLIQTFLDNILYYFDLTPILFILGTCSVAFVAFALWRLVLFIYNLIPVIR